MAVDTVARDGWVERVLGIARAAASVSAWREALAEWRGACEDVDWQIKDLERSLVASGDEDFIDIARHGLPGLLAGPRAKIDESIALLDRHGAGADTLLPALRDLRALVRGDPRIWACDHNHFGIQVTIKATLVPAIDAMSRALSAKPGAAP